MIRIDGQGYHLMVKARLYGYSMNLVLDTGATRSVLDAHRTLKIVPQANPRPWNKLFSGIGGENLQTQCLQVSEFCIEDVPLPQREFILLDLHKINHVYSAFDLPRIDGVLGGDILMEYQGVINYKEQYLQLEI